MVYAPGHALRTKDVGHGILLAKSDLALKFLK